MPFPLRERSRGEGFRRSPNGTSFFVARHFSDGEFGDALKRQNLRFDFTQIGGGFALDEADDDLKHFIRVAAVI